jgi:cytochrome c551
MHKIVVALLALTLVLSVSACNRNNNGAPDDTPPAGSPGGSPGASPGGSPAASPGASPTGGTADAQALYKQQCIACHAADMSGGVGPNLQHVGARMSAADIAGKISNGGGGMTAFKGVLTDAQIQALGNWLSSQK